ncbi:sensory histidine kinase [Candidatus Williamhamiltonella defendens]|nr:ATP-binding protein [Candidatus Hamiltonella defensa]AYB48710.1 sensory histidine kinase [Candidatus Hamiltonella defensa]
MTQYSFRARMMILMLSPTVLLGLLLSAFFMMHRYHELEKQVIHAGTYIIQSLAVVSEYAMTYQNKEFARRLIYRQHRQHSSIVKSIAIFNTDNTLFVTSNSDYYSLRLPKNTPIPTKLMRTHLKNSLILRMPITSEHHLVRFLGYHLPVNNRQEPVLGYIAIDLDLQATRLQQRKECLILGVFLSFAFCMATLFIYRLKIIGQATSDLRKTLAKMEIQHIELEMTKKKVQEDSHMKSEFLANISHELRTPLNSVIGFARQTLKTSLTPTQTDYIKTMKQSAHNLLSIINDVLDFSKLNAKKLILDHIPFQLRKNVDEVMILLAHSAHEKGLELILKIHHDVPDWVMGDPMRFQQIITNLLGNAIKFTEKGHIIVQVALIAKKEASIHLLVEIQDTGKGIAPEQQAELFQAFIQADASISRCHGGTGLGLAITRKLVQAMQGEINFDSQVNQGSTFRFNIKLDLNQQITDLPLPMDILAGKQLAYIESNSVVAKASLDILNMTPLKVTYAASFMGLPKQNYDFVLLGVPIPVRDNMAEHNDQLMTAMALADEIILALPSQSHVDSEQLKQLGAKGCLIKPISARRLFPLLLEKKTFKKNAPSEFLPTASTYLSNRLAFRVMAVDDNPANLKLIGTLLEPLVDKIILCSNGEEALSIATQTQLDVILIDIQMPKMDGIRTSELIHQLPLHRNTPIIAVTAYTTQGQNELLLASGITDYLTKPINENCLIQAISRYSKKMVSHSPAIFVGGKIPPVSLDWDLALKQAAYKKDLACDLLKMLLELLPDVKKRVQEILALGDKTINAEEEANILSVIHQLHGSAAYSGLPQLQKICGVLEKELHKKTLVKDLQAEWFELLDEIENVTIAAEAHLSQFLS